jgi:heme-degrading monooxygenase HmoA
MAGRTHPSVYVSLSRLRIDAGLADGLIVAFRSRAHLVDEVDGFVDLQVWQGQSDPGEVVMVSRWRDREAFRTYMRSDRHATSHARIPPALQAAIRLERLEHLTGFVVVAE